MRIISTAVIAAGILAASAALAQEETTMTTPLAAPSNALELKAGAGYTQGFGGLTPTQSITDVAGAGLGVNADVDYRFDPHWSFGLQAEYQEFNANLNANSGARGLAGNLGVTFHAMPFIHGDPWLRLGTGYRMLWSVDPVGGAPNTLIHGFELAKATVGYDFRVSPGVAIAPLVGADINLWTWQVQDGVNTALPSARVWMYVFAGMQARFDVGTMVEPVAATAER